MLLSLIFLIAENESGVKVPFGSAGMPQHNVKDNMRERCLHSDALRGISVAT
jgi:hypothetical protein